VQHKKRPWGQARTTVCYRRKKGLEVHKASCSGGGGKGTSASGARTQARSSAGTQNREDSGVKQKKATQTLHKTHHNCEPGTRKGKDYHLTDLWGRWVSFLEEPEGKKPTALNGGKTRLMGKVDSLGTVNHNTPNMTLYTESSKVFLGLLSLGKKNLR